MSQDIAFTKVALNDTNFADLALLNGDLVADDGIETAVLISLFSDRYIPKEELDEGADTRGWWGDALSEISEDRIGSRLWLAMDRGKINAATKNQMKDFAEESLEWLISEGVAAKVEVTTFLVQNTRIEIFVNIFRPSGDNIPFRFLWDGQALKRG